MDAKKLLQSYERYQQLSRAIPDSAVFEYASHVDRDELGTTQKWLRFPSPSELEKMNNIAMAAVMLHEKEEIYQIIQRGYSLDRAVADGPSKNPAYHEAHGQALRVEYKFLQECARSEGLDTSVEALAIVNPKALEGAPSVSVMMGITMRELSDYGLFERMPTRDEADRAVEFFKRGGAKYPDSLNKILAYVDFFGEMPKK